MINMYERTNKLEAQYFIYVTTEEGYEYLLERGYEFMGHRDKLWCFLNKDEMQFECPDIPHVISDTYVI